MRRRAGVLTLLIALAGPGGGARAASSAASDQVLPVTVQLPYGFLFLHLPAFSANLPPPGSWTFEAGLTVTNNFIYSDNFGEALEARTSRTPVTMSDIDAIATAHPGEDYYYFDGEVTTLYAFVARSITPSFGIGARLSAVGISGGDGMDGFVEGFHNTFGLGQAYRDVVTRGSISAAVKINGEDETILEYDREGIGDPIVYGIWGPDLGERWRMSLGAGVKVPIGSVDKRLSTGEFDIGTAFAVTGDFDRWLVNVNGGVVFPGDVDFLPGLDSAPVFGVSGSFGYRFSSTSLWVQLQWEQSPLRDATQTPLSDDVHDLTLGVRFPLGGRVRGYFAVTENIFAFDNSSDIGFHGGVTWRAGTP